MNRHHLAVAVLLAAAGFCLSGSLVRAEDPKEKPKGAATLDDRTAMATETVDGKEKATKVDLKFTLKVKGFFDKDGLNIEDLDGDGPAANLSDADGNKGVTLEKGDIIREIDGKPVKSAADYVKALNGVADNTKVKLKVRDINTGKDQEFFAEAQKRS